MPIATLQAQIKQLQAQLKLSQSPKQTKMLQGAIARLEQKLTEEKAAQPKVEQATVQSPKKESAQTDQSNPPKQKKTKTSKPKIEVVKAIAQDQSEAIALKEPEADAPIVDKEPPPQLQKESHEPKKKTRRVIKPLKDQILSDGTILKSVPGQGYHQFFWHVFGKIQADEDDNITVTIDDGDLAIPVSLGERAKKTLKNISLPISRFCSLYPRITDGGIDGALLNACAKTESGNEIFKAIGYWIAEEQTLQIQSNFRFSKERSQNIFLKIPLRDGMENPGTGFRSLQIERDRLKLFIVGENE